MTYKQWQTVLLLGMQFMHKGGLRGTLRSGENITE